MPGQGLSHGATVTLVDAVLIPAAPPSAVTVKAPMPDFGSACTSVVPIFGVSIVNGASVDLLQE